MKYVVIAAAALMSCIAVSEASSADYSSMSTGELSRMRDSIGTAPEQVRNEFEKEWEKRIRTMSEEERRKYLGDEKAKEYRERERQQEEERLRIRDRDGTAEEDRERQREREQQGEHQGPDSEMRRRGGGR